MPNAISVPKLEQGNQCFRRATQNQTMVEHIARSLLVSCPACKPLFFNQLPLPFSFTNRNLQTCNLNANQMWMTGLSSLLLIPFAFFGYPFVSLISSALYGSPLAIRYPHWFLGRRWSEEAPKSFFRFPVQAKAWQTPPPLEASYQLAQSCCHAGFRGVHECSSQSCGRKWASILPSAHHFFFNFPAWTWRPPHNFPQT